MIWTNTEKSPNNDVQDLLTFILPKHDVFDESLSVLTAAMQSLSKP